MTRPHAIKAMGIRKYLNTHKELHNNNGYNEFIQMLRFGTPKPKMADRFGVSKVTIYKWINQLENEKNQRKKERASK